MHIRNPDPDEFRSLLRKCAFTDTSVRKNNEHPIVLSTDMSESVEKCVISHAMLKNPSKKFLDSDPEANDFQNVTSSSPDQSLSGEIW